MARDYAKRRFKSKKPQKKRIFLWLILLILGATCLTIFVGQNTLLHQYPWLKNLKQNILPNKLLTEKNLKVTHESQVTTPKFSFYDISPQKPGDSPQDNYELNIAITENFAAADRLKAELALLGFAASITPIYEHNIQKYYVSVGPYANEEKAISDLQKLKTNQIKGELKKIR